MSVNITMEDVKKDVSTPWEVTAVPVVHHKNWKRMEEIALVSSP